MNQSAPNPLVEGYSDTPFLPDQPYRVHDHTRPHPRVVTPGVVPSDATILFDGISMQGWESVVTGGQAEWNVENGCMEVVLGTGDIRTSRLHGDIQLHLEWMTPAEVEGDGQKRGNSGVFLQSIYEVQILDCYRNPTYADGCTGALYGQCPPLVNACTPPGHWQTYDILFVAARWSEGRLLAPAFITVIHNGIVLHHHRAFHGPTRWKAVSSYCNPPAVGPLKLQGHGNKVKFRNLWWRALCDYDV